MTTDIRKAEWLAGFLSTATTPVERLAIVLWFDSDITKAEAIRQAQVIVAGGYRSTTGAAGRAGNGKLSN